LRDFNAIDLVDINKRKGFPRTYRFNRFTRWFTIILALFAIIYAVWYVFTAVDVETSTIRKIIPFVIIFLAGNSLFRNLFSLNTVTLFEDRITFGFLLAKDVTIRWEQIAKLSVYSGKTKAIVLHYNTDEGRKQFTFTMVFPNMLEIINSIAEKCPDIQYDDFLKNIIIPGKKTNNS